MCDQKLLRAKGPRLMLPRTYACTRPLCATHHEIRTRICALIGAPNGYQNGKTLTSIQGRSDCATNKAVNVAFGAGKSILRSSAAESYIYSKPDSAQTSNAPQTW